MTVWSNPVGVSVGGKTRIPVVRVTLRADKTRARVGEPVNFSGEVYIAEPAPSEATFRVLIEVNGEVIGDTTCRIEPGDEMGSFSFTLKFDRAGSYTVRAGAPDYVEF